MSLDNLLLKACPDFILLEWKDVYHQWNESLKRFPCFFHHVQAIKVIRRTLATSVLSDSPQGKLQHPRWMECCRVDLSLMFLNICIYSKFCGPLEGNTIFIFFVMRGKVESWTRTKNYIKPIQKPYVFSTCWNNLYHSHFYYIYYSIWAEVKIADLKIKRIKLMPFYFTPYNIFKWIY